MRARGEAGDHPNDAIADYSKVIGLAPRFDLAYLYRAQLNDGTGDHQSATTDYKRAIDLTPTLGEAYRLLARHEYDANDLLYAFTYAHKAIELDTCAGAFEEYNVDCNDDYYLLGTLEAKYYDVTEPTTAAEQAIRFWPKAPEPYCLLATL